MTGALVFRTAMISHMGLVRRLNEDSVLAKPEIGLWAVADGMGGHGGGDIASHAVVEALELLAPQASASNLLGEFERCVVRVNGQLRDFSRERKVGHGNDLGRAHDSRSSFISTSAFP